MARYAQVGLRRYHQVLVITFAYGGHCCLVLIQPGNGVVTVLFRAGLVFAPLSFPIRLTAEVQFNVACPRQPLRVAAGKPQRGGANLYTVLVVVMH
ncbi:hypothetical protein D3C85_1290420 [compost metagenome]